MKRREFLNSGGLIALTAAGGLVGSRSGSAATLAAGGAPQAGSAQRNPEGEPHTKRWHEQRWILDNIIKANGVDWDQSHTGGILKSCGLGVASDMAAVRQRVKKFSDIVSAFESVGRKRETQASKAESRGDIAVARDNYFIAAQCYGQAMWPIYENNDLLRSLNEKKRAVYSKYMRFADHHVEWVEIPYRGKTLPAVFHLPPGYQPGVKTSVVVMVPGMDGFKEKYVSLYGDSLMDRGIAVLAVDGPGYWESPVRGLYIDVPGWQETGKNVMNWLVARPEVDASKIGIVGSSYGSFFSAIMLSDEHRYSFCTVHGTCYEPGGETIFNTASVTFKKRFMFMSGITDEAEFDEFRKTLNWHGYAESIKTPYLILAGGADQLCPTKYTDEFVRALGGPKQLLVYQDADHGVGGSPAATNGPNAEQFQSDWIADRIKQAPIKSERWSIDVAGQVTKVSL